MRIRRLELKAFGPFTDRVLDFDGDASGLHIVYGPNEAGKSSTLRALSALFYGFPERTSDNFIHPNDRLLVAGVLEDGRGKPHFFARRKKRKADLLDAEQNPVDPAQLDALLHGIDHAMFSHLFGLDHDTLVAGGAALLQDKGHAGSTLFSAGTGIVAPRRILNKLQEESDALFKTRASKPVLNAALRDFTSLKSEINRLSLSSREFKDHDKALREAIQSLEKAQQKRAEISRSQRQLERIRQAFTPLGLRRELQVKLRELGDVRPLPDDFHQRREQALNQLRSARQSLSAAQERFKDFSARIDELNPPRGLIDQAETVGHLHQRVGAYRKAMVDRPVLEGKRVQAKTEAGRILRSVLPGLSLEQADELRNLLRRRSAVKRLGQEHLLATEKLEHARQALTKLENEKSALESSLRALNTAPDVQQLKSLLARAQALGAIDSDLGLRRQDLGKRQNNFDIEIRRLGLWQGTPDQLVSLALPFAETVDRFVALARELAQESRNLKSRRQEVEQKLRETNHELEALEKTGDLLTENDLKRLRHYRDRGWHLLRRQWIDGEEVAVLSREYHEHLPLHEAYEEAVDQADAAADRLRREADRVQAFAHMTARRDEMNALRKQLDADHTELDARKQEFEQEWCGLWHECGVSPRSTEEMAAWLSRIETLRVSAARIVEDRQRMEELTRQRSEAANPLRLEIVRLQKTAPEGEELNPLIDAALALVRTSEESAQQRRSLQQRLDTVEQELQQAGQEVARGERVLNDWERSWETILKEFGLETGIMPAEMEEIVEGVESCLNQIDKATEHAGRIAGIDRDTEQLKQDVHALLQLVAPQLQALPVDQAVEQLNALLSRAREQQTRLQAYSDAIEEAEAEIRTTSAVAETAQAELDELCALAGCGSEEGLEAAEKLWLQKQDLEQRIAEEEKRLTELAEGMPLVEFEQRVCAVDPDSLPERLQRMTEELDELNHSIQDFAEQVGRERTELARMDGRAEAALKAQQAEEKLSEIRRLSDRYVRLRVAARVLEEEIERYRARNQDPVLRLAGGYFAELTLNSFDGLRVDVDDRGEPIIVGLRNEGEQVTSDNMSSGTRDQMFLALRLASLEHRLERNEPMPFIVDDILINFDEERACATLAALSRLAARNQVILFTHHRQVAEEAEKINAQVIPLA